MWGIIWWVATRKWPTRGPPKVYPNFGTFFGVRVRDKFKYKFKVAAWLLQRLKSTFSEIFLLSTGPFHFWGALFKKFQKNIDFSLGGKQCGFHKLHIFLILFHYAKPYLCIFILRFTLRFLLKVWVSTYITLWPFIVCGNCNFFYNKFPSDFEKKNLNYNSMYSNSLINTQIGSKNIQKPWYYEFYTKTIWLN